MEDPLLDEPVIRTKFHSDACPFKPIPPEAAMVHYVKVVTGLSADEFPNCQMKTFMTKLYLSFVTVNRNKRSWTMDGWIFALTYAMLEVL